jgi:hypothetical protein
MRNDNRHRERILAAEDVKLEHVFEKKSSAR